MEYICAVDGRYEASIPICVENVGFDMLGKLLGADGKNMIYIEQCTGVGLNLDGEASAFMNPSPRPGPLCLVIRHDSEDSVKAAIPLVEHLVATMKTSYDIYLENILREDPHLRDGSFIDLVQMHPHFVQIPLNVEATNDFDIFEPLLGKDGKNLEYIEQCTEALLTLQGSAAQSVNLNAADGPVRVLIRHKTEEGLAETVPLVESLIEVVQEEYKSYMKDALCGRYTSRKQGRHGEFACNVCEIQCPTKTEYEAHCNGALHARNQLAQAVNPKPKVSFKTQPSPAAAIPGSSQAGGSAQSEKTSQEESSVSQFNYPELPLFQLHFFKEFSMVQASQSFRDHLNQEIAFEVMNPALAQQLEAKARNPNYCLVCEIVVQASYGAHFTTHKHRMNYLKLQRKYGTKTFAAYYGVVPLPGVNVRGGHNYATGACNFKDYNLPPPMTRYGHEEMVLLAGMHQEYYCSTCCLRLSADGWLTHVQGKKHAMVCMDQLAKSGPYQYLWKFQYAPAPLPDLLRHLNEFVGVTETQSDEVKKFLPNFGPELWPKLRYLADKERKEQADHRRAQRREQAKAERDNKRKQGQDDDNEVPQKKSREEERLDRTLVRRLQNLTKVQNVAILEAALNHMRKQNVDLDSLLNLLDSDKMKEAVAGTGGVGDSGDKFTAIVARLVNFSGE